MMTNVFKLFSTVMYFCRKMPYEFSDLQITNEFENRPNLGQYQHFFSMRFHKSYRRQLASAHDNIGQQEGPEGPGSLT